VNVTIIDIEDSQGIIIPQEILDSLGWKCGDVLDLRETNGILELMPPQHDSNDELKAFELAMKMSRIALRELEK
jgi:bifunctional DNA-binding transcriptional regulator/antitoxin component of YhaV-PrlF toxin-antitoxin module